MYIIPLLSCLHHQHRQYRYVHLHQVDIVSTLCNLFLLIYIVNVTILTNIKSTLRFAFYEWCKRNSIPYTDYLFKNSITEACEHFFFNLSWSLCLPRMVLWEEQAVDVKIGEMYNNDKTCFITVDASNEIAITYN